VHEKYKLATLEWVNTIRADVGLPLLAELPQGNPCSGRNCPVARGLSGVTATGVEITSYVSTAAYEVGPRGPGRYERRGRLGPWVHEFVHAFDHGYYPELRAA
jgi:hypothetical protein